jgi:hypothetical protein
MDPYIEAILFPTPPLELKYLNKYKEGIIQIPISEKNKERIPCYFQKKKESKDILIIFHGNGSDIFNLSYYAKEISEKNNINIIIPEYPGYSIYITNHSEQKCLENSLIIYDFILNNIKNISEKNIYILGRSLGSAVASFLASKRNPAGIFLISPFTSFASVGLNDEEDKQILSKYFRIIDYINKIKSPILFIHGKSDPLVNYKESITLFEKCNKDIIKEIVLIEDMAHNFSFYFVRDRIIPCINNFAKKNCLWKSEIENEKDLNIIDFDKKFYINEEEINNIIKYFESY